MLDLEGYEGFKIKSEKMLDVFREVYDFAHHGQPIIMFGPSGAGKEYLARYYYKQYQKASNCSGKFISVNCSQLVKETTQSTLFGHKRGSFTDAQQDQAGQFELAKKGVLFLDEIGDLDQAVQTMVNRAMDENIHEAMKLGDKTPYSTKDVKVICATERPKEHINDSLLYRSGLQVYVPGLDERDEDVEEAIKYFALKAIDKRLDKDQVLRNLVKQARADFGKDLTKEPGLKPLSEKIATRLGPFVRDRDWPGNFRALRAAVDSGIIRAKKLNSIADFTDDVEKYFLHHLGNYSIAGEEDEAPPTSVITTTTASGSGKWLHILAKKGCDLDDKEKARLSQFLSEFEDIPFKRKIFEEYMNLSTRNAQYRLHDLDEMEIIEKMEGKGYKYQVRKKYRESGRPGINPSHFMTLPGPVDEGFMMEKIIEAQGIIGNARSLFVSDDDPPKRELFLGALGEKIKQDHDVIYFSFEEHSLEDFITACIEHLKSLNMDGWYSNLDDDKPDLKGKISGLSGYFIRSLSRQRSTIIILEGIDAFNTGESQALIEQLIYYWYPVQFILGSEKQFVRQRFSTSPGFTELKL